MGRPSFAQRPEAAACLRLGGMGDGQTTMRGFQKCFPLSISRTVKLLALKEQLFFFSALTSRCQHSSSIIFLVAGPCRWSRLPDGKAKAGTLESIKMPSNHEQGFLFSLSSHLLHMTVMIRKMAPCNRN